VFRCSNGKYLLWFHNHDARDTAPLRNKHRHPAWISGGVLKDGVIQWSQPEILLYGFSFPFNAGMSYPDLIEEDGRYWVTETQKTTARIHEIDPDLLAGVWDCDAGLLKAGAKHHVTFIVDGGPRIILVVVDGVLCDGGRQRKAGWTWFQKSLGDVGGAGGFASPLSSPADCTRFVPTTARCVSRRRSLVIASNASATAMVHAVMGCGHHLANPARTA
jgi:hypothetical protein